MNAIIIHLGLVFLAQAAPLSVGELLTNADRFNGQPVTVTGKRSAMFVDNRYAVVAPCTPSISVTPRGRFTRLCLRSRCVNPERRRLRALSGRRSGG